VDARVLLETILSKKKDFRPVCKKYSGAITVELLRRALNAHGIPTSPRDVFIKGLGIELDLVVPAGRAEPEYGLLYDPQAVRAALEVKNWGAFPGTEERIKKNFRRVRNHCQSQDVLCAYVTLMETEGARRVTTESLATPGCEAYTLFLRRGAEKNAQYEDTTEFKKLIARLRELTAGDGIGKRETHADERAVRTPCHLGNGPAMVVIEALTERRARDVLRVLARRARVRAGYLFGSQVEGTADRWSDIDVAAFIDEADQWDFEQRVAACVEAREEVGDDVELHLFPSASLTNPPRASFAEYVLKHGLALDAKDLRVPPEE